MTNPDTIDQRAKARASGWRTIRRVMPYLWPREASWVKHRVIWAMLFLLASKLIATVSPLVYKFAVDSLAGDASGPGVLLAIGAVGLTIAYGLTRLMNVGFQQLRQWHIFRFSSARSLLQAEPFRVDPVMPQLGT